MVVEDDDIRRACIDAAQRHASKLAQQETQEPSQQASQSPPILPEQRVEAPSADAARQREENEPNRPIPNGASAQGARAAPSHEPPDEFSGTVSRVYQSILDRQLIAVDAKYLFASDRAAHARLAEGERVEVEKVSSRFFGTGRQWRIMGSSRTPIVAFRIRCEIQDIRSDDRRKCMQMLDR